MRNKGGTPPDSRVPYIAPGCSGPLEVHRCRVGVRLWSSGPVRPAPVTGCRCPCHDAERNRLYALAADQHRRAA